MLKASAAPVPLPRAVQLHGLVVSVANKSTPFSLCLLETSFSPGEQHFFPVSCESEEAVTISVCLILTVSRVGIGEALL